MLKKILVVVAVVAAVISMSLYFGGFFKPGTFSVSGTVTREYVWFTEPVENTWVFITAPNGMPCASTVTDADGRYAFDFVIGNECDFSGITVSEGLWTIQVPFLGETREVEFVNGAHLTVDIAA